MGIVDRLILKEVEETWLPIRAGGTHDSKIADSGLEGTMMLRRLEICWC